MPPGNLSVERAQTAPKQGKSSQVDASHVHPQEAVDSRGHACSTDPEEVSNLGGALQCCVTQTTLVTNYWPCTEEK